MKAGTIFKGYALHGMTEELAELVVPSDLEALKKIERELADAIVADYVAHVYEGRLEAPAMKTRVANLKRGSTYLDCYMTELQKRAHPRGVIISYPDGGNSGRWHGNKWTTSDRRRFDHEIQFARESMVKWKTRGFPIRETETIVSAVGGRWLYELHRLVAVLGQRLSD